MRAAPAGTSQRDAAAVIERAVAQINDPSFVDTLNTNLQSAGVVITSVRGSDTTPLVDSDAGTVYTAGGALLSAGLCLATLLVKLGERP